MKRLTVLAALCEVLPDMPIDRGELRSLLVIHFPELDAIDWIALQTQLRLHDQGFYYIFGSQDQMELHATAAGWPFPLTFTLRSAAARIKLVLREYEVMEIMVSEITRNCPIFTNQICIKSACLLRGGNHELDQDPDHALATCANKIWGKMLNRILKQAGYDVQ